VAPGFYLRYFFHIAYNGSNYSGWQKLPKINSVQSILETLISRVVKSATTIVGCGRTDSHVHASQYFFHVDLDETIIPELMFRMNKNLPGDIGVFDIIPMQGLPHARLDATERKYDYFIHRYKDPFLTNCSALYQEPNLDLLKMKEAVALLTRYNDYRGFYRTASKVRTTKCSVKQATLAIDHTGDRLKFTISANRFLRGMVRVIVHKLLEVGRGKITVEQFENYLRGTETPKDIKPAYPQGLYLSKVTYPFLDLPPRSKFDQLVNGAGTWLPLS
jgi:tRNA pseudouridine38-40 synthase